MAVEIAAVVIPVAITGITMITSKLARRSLHNHSLFLALLIAVILCGFCTTVRAADSSKVDSFAKCLADKKTTMYGSLLCPHCDDQKKLFGAAFRYVPYVECTTPGSRQLTFICRAAQIQFTPT